MSDTEREFWSLFNRILGIRLSPGNYMVDEIDEWDSLRHIELIFEFEEHFNVSIKPEAIVELYSETSKFLRYLETNSGE